MTSAPPYVHLLTALFGAAVLVACTPPTLITAHVVQRGGSRDAGQPPADSGPRTDGGVPQDAGRPDGSCGAPSPWVTQTRTLASVEVFGGPPPPAGSTLRLRVAVNMERSCDTLPAIRVTATPGGATDFVGLSAEVWTRQDCAALASTQWRLVVVEGRGLDNGRVVVQDEHSNATVLTVERRRCTDMGCLCQFGDPAGSQSRGQFCVTDCDCSSGLLCLGASAGPNAERTCQKPCEDDKDCIMDNMGCVSAGPGLPPQVCAEVAACTAGPGCPGGFECTPEGPSGSARCQDVRTYPSQRGCRCDADCDPADHCARVGETTRCERLCSVDHDCPGFEQSITLCAIPRVCRPLD